jgi:hypothetical protein
MELIQKNPFRIIGLLSNTTARDLQSRKGLITRYLSIGRQLESDYDFSFLTDVLRTENVVSQAFSKIEMNQDKINQSLFWFVKANSFDETALDYLKIENPEKASEIWSKVITGKEVTSKNFSNFNNLGTLKLLSNSNSDLREGIELKLNLIESASFMDFVSIVGDVQTYNLSKKQQSVKFIDSVIGELHLNYKTAEIFNMFSNCNEEARNYVTQKFTDEPIHVIEIAIEDVKSKRKAEPKEACRFGNDLQKETSDNLLLLENLLNRDHLKFRMISDRIAKEMLQCGIDSFTKGNRDERSLKNSINLLKSARKMAINTLTIERIDSNIEELENIRYSEIIDVLGLLNHLRDIIKEVNRSFNRQTLNKEKVEEFLIREVTDSIIRKIVSTDRKKYLDEFIELIVFIGQSVNGAVIGGIKRSLLKELPPNHPFVILEKKRIAEEQERQRLRDIKIKEEKEAQKIKEKEGRVIFFSVLGFLIFIIILIGFTWGWGWAAFSVIVGVYLLAVLGK